MTKARSHLASISNSLTRFSKASAFLVISLAVRSRACSRNFFFIRNRADAAVLRRRLSSSAARRSASLGSIADEALVLGCFLLREDEEEVEVVDEAVGVAGHAVGLLTNPPGVGAGARRGKARGADGSVTVGASCCCC